MRTVIKFPTESQEIIYAEIFTDDEGVIRASNFNEEAESSSRSFEQAVEVLRTITKSILRVVSQQEHRPDDFEIELGLRLDSKMGAVISAKPADANIIVKMHWNANAKSRV